MATNDQKLDVLMHEFDYVSSMIALYRRAQLQITALGLTAYAAFLALLGHSLRAGAGTSRILLTVSAVAPWLVFAIVGCFIMAETRIMRASRYLEKVLYPRVHAIVGVELLSWEKSPGKGIALDVPISFRSRIRWFPQHVFSTSTALILTMAAPALVAGVLYLVGDRRPVAGAWTWVGLGFLAGLAFYGIWISTVQEKRVQ